MGCPGKTNRPTEMTSPDVYPAAFLMEGFQPSWGPVITGEHSLRQQVRLSNTATGTGWQVGRHTWQQRGRSQPRYMKADNHTQEARDSHPIQQVHRTLIFLNSIQY